MFTQRHIENPILCLIGDMRNVMQQLAHRIDTLTEENVAYQMLVIENNAYLQEQIKQMDHRIRAMENIFSLETNDGR